MPWDPRIFRERAEDIADEAGLSRKAGEAGNLAVRRHATAGNAGNRSPDPLVRVGPPGAAQWQWVADRSGGKAAAEREALDSASEGGRVQEGFGHHAAECYVSHRSAQATAG